MSERVSMRVSIRVSERVSMRVSEGEDCWAGRLVFRQLGD